jgi:uncharacterized protein (DUF2164 family)
MAIELNPEKRQRCLASIKEYMRENLELDIGDLKAGLLLDYVLKDIGPIVYNKAVADARQYMEERLVDLEAACYETEFPDDRR